MIGIAESEAPGDLFECLHAVLNQWPRRLDTQALDSFRRRHSDRCREHAAKLAHAHMCNVCQAFDRQIITQVIAHMAQHRADPIRARVEIQQRRELILATGSPIVDNQHARDGA
ncbi:hypothetical protein D3C87_1723530 [compost metagenome]